MKNDKNNKLIKQISNFYNEFHLKHDRKPPYWMEMYWNEFIGNVLEIGAGTLVPVKNENISNYLVIEVSPVAVRILKGKGINAIVGDGEKLPFQKNTFDTVACHDVLEHTPNPERFIAEMCRVSRKKVIILGPNYCGEEESILRKKSNLIKRTQNIIKGGHKKIVNFKNPYFTYDKKWESDLDAVTGVNLWWVKKQIKKNKCKIIKSTTFIGESIATKILGEIPLLKYAGYMMFVVAEKK